MKCSKCGQESSGNFCSNCGTELKDDVNKYTPNQNDIENDENIKEFTSIDESNGLLGWIINSVKKKPLFGVIIAVVLLIALGCFITVYTISNSPTGLGNPSYTFTDSDYNAGVRAVGIVDNYLDYKITKSEAYEKIDEIDNRISGIKNDLGSEDKIDSDKSFSHEETLLFLQVELDSLECEFIDHNPNDKDVLEHRNDLAEMLDVEKRT